MEFEKGERVFLNFETGGVEKTSQEPEPEHEQPVIPAFDFVGDILEHNPSSAPPPVAPSPRANTNGFPAHKKRVPRVSAFKQQRAAKEQQQQQQQQQQQHVAPPVAQPQNTSVPRARFDPNEERRAIDEENMRRLDTMSEAEIEEERRELMENLSPALLQKLLARSNLDEGSNERSWPDESQAGPAAPREEQKEKQQETQEMQDPAPTQPPSAKKVSFAPPESEDELTSPPPQANHDHPPHSHSTPIDPELATGSLHFAPIPQPPDLDPNDPDFLQALHEKYFPSLPYNPATLSWMAPVDPSDATSAYHPSRSALNASELRFDFTGALLAPSVARAIPTDRGLHHHADAPEAAGYTIAELAVTARSAVSAQRCVAYQTLGRILYRLGQGEFGEEKARRETDGPVKVVRNPGVEEDGGEVGEEEEEVDESDDVGHYMAAGLWSCIEEGRVIETLTEEASREKGHLTARTFAQEALWNWRRGGGRKRHAV